MSADSSPYTELNGKRAFVTGGAKASGAPLRTRLREAV